MSDASDLPILEDLPRQGGKRYDVHDRDEWFGAVLMADEIRHYCTKATPRMIDPFCEPQLRPASYTLRLGRELNIGGKYRRLGDGESFPLDPHQVAVVSTAETLNIPRFLIARWNLRVTRIYEGLLWTGGPQVDPGWAGQLYCPIYNLAERQVELREGSDFFTIDFIRTTALTDEYLALRERPQTQRTWFTPQRRSLADHDRYQIHSAPFERLAKLESYIEAVDDLRRMGGTFLTVIVAVLGAIIAALAIVVIDPATESGGELVGGWARVALVFSVIAAVLSLASLVFWVLSPFRRGDRR